MAGCLFRIRTIFCSFSLYVQKLFLAIVFWENLGELPCPPLRDNPHPEIKPASFCISFIAGRFFTTEPLWNPFLYVFALDLRKQTFEERGISPVGKNGHRKVSVVDALRTDYKWHVRAWRARFDPADGRDVKNCLYPKSNGMAINKEIK